MCGLVFVTTFVTGVLIVGYVKTVIFLVLCDWSKLIPIKAFYSTHERNICRTLLRLSHPQSYALECFRWLCSACKCQCHECRCFQILSLTDFEMTTNTWHKFLIPSTRQWLSCTKRCQDCQFVNIVAQVIVLPWIGRQCFSKIILPILSRFVS